MATTTTAATASTFLGTRLPDGSPTLGVSACGPFQARFGFGGGGKRTIAPMKPAGKSPGGGSDRPLWFPASSFLHNHLHVRLPKKSFTRTSRAINAVATPALEEPKKCTLPTWAEFDIGRAPLYWKTMNGLPPMSGEKLTLFYNPAASKLVPNDEFGIAFNGGFNQPIMCGGEPRAMTRKNRGKADPPIYTIKICVPKHAVNLIFSFTNGVDWDGPYKLQFKVLKRWQNKPMGFFNGGLAEEMSQDGACERAIFPDSNIVITRCAMIANLSAEGGNRCNLDLVTGCMDPSSPLFNPLANVDDGSCPLDSDVEDE